MIKPFNKGDKVRILKPIPFWNLSIHDTYEVMDYYPSVGNTSYLILKGTWIGYEASNFITIKPSISQFYDKI